MKQRPVSRNNGKYSLLYSKESDESGEETELSVRSNYKETPTVEKKIEEGDTLQSLSIRYHCSISELKRLNNIHRENEIFARPTIKVPYRAFLLETVPVHKSGSSTPSPTTSASVDSKILKEKLETVSSETSSVNEVIFNSNINTLPVEDEPDDEIEDVQLLPVHQQSPEISPTIITNLKCNGDDCGISWPILIGCLLLLGFACPLIYVFYIAEHPEKFHHES